MQAQDAHTAMNEVRLFIWYLDAEFLDSRKNLGHWQRAEQVYLLNRHHNFHSIQAIKSEIVCKVCFGIKLLKGQSQVMPFMLFEAFEPLSGLEPTMISIRGSRESERRRYLIEIL